jgi:hypothetical protein
LKTSNGSPRLKKDNKAKINNQMQYFHLGDFKSLKNAGVIK